MSKTTPENHRPLVICTNKRGVFFGYAANDGPTNEQIHAGDTVTLKRARMAVYWDCNTKGVLGLAATGPTKGCRIGPAAGSITLGGGPDNRQDCVLDVESEEAVERWELAPWRA